MVLYRAGRGVGVGLLEVRRRLFRGPRLGDALENLLDCSPELHLRCHAGGQSKRRQRARGEHSEAREESEERVAAVGVICRSPAIGMHCPRLASGVPLKEGAYAPGLRLSARMKCVWFGSSLCTPGHALCQDRASVRDRAAEVRPAFSVCNRQAIEYTTTSLSR